MVKFSLRRIHIVGYFTITVEDYRIIHHVINVLTQTRLLIVCIQVVLTVMMNIVSAALAITTIVLYSVDLVGRQYNYWCHLPDRQEDDRYSWTTASPAKKAEQEEIYQMKLERYRVCQEHKLIMKVITLANFRILIPQVRVLKQRCRMYTMWLITTSKFRQRLRKRRNPLSDCHALHTFSPPLCILQCHDMKNSP